MSKASKAKTKAKKDKEKKAKAIKPQTSGIAKSEVTKMLANLMRQKARLVAELNALEGAIGVCRGLLNPKPPAKKKSAPQAPTPSA